ncbi:hypothetical protein [Geodermatophilus sabuli]|uniref:Uncharacterized protein n=1 Tax=Geodermatophilus sabuli TaxID=1564158 RepID=A0A285EJ84_9ACTN|nr:hypothetical protein [Geodermatophilus sabuli]MBB3083100.1 hypothetical protein [Geodermatophilus sabuli]SNX98096.1 hypothetical protein SAMN06893097_109176 [Geodermatophilus sabuli]
MPIIDFPATDVRPRGRTKRRLLQLPIAATAVLGAVALTAAPASAAQTCKPVTGSNLCLSINQRADGNFDVHVGIDVHMPLDKAQEYVDDEGDPFTVWIRGEDGKHDENLFSVPMTPGTLVATPESGLSADFDTVVAGRDLDEDRGGRDEIFAQVQLIDTDNGEEDKGEGSPFISHQIFGNWPF